VLESSIIFVLQTELLEECDGKEITLPSHGKNILTVQKMFMLMVKMYPFTSNLRVLGQKSNSSMPSAKTC